MKRINVIGTTGSGKTTFSKELSSVLGISYIQLDELFWKPNWVESKDEEFLPKVAAAVSEDTWVLDGNFSRTKDIKWQRADTVIWLDFNYFLTLTQLLKRTVYRAITKGELWPNTDNRESFKKSFFDRSSILMWFFKNYKSNRKKYFNAMQSKEYPNLNFVHIQNRKEARDYIENARNKFKNENAASGTDALNAPPF